MSDISRVIKSVLDKKTKEMNGLTFLQYYNHYSGKYGTHRVLEICKEIRVETLKEYFDNENIWADSILEAFIEFDINFNNIENLKDKTVELYLKKIKEKEECEGK